MRNKKEANQSEKAGQSGFTLIELLVAIFVFSVIGGATFGVLISGIDRERGALATQSGINQVSYVIEYISRATRQAQKDTGGSCITAGSTYTNLSPPSDPGTGIRFIDREGNCRSIYWKTTDNQLWEQIGGGTEYALTSTDFEVVVFKAALHGAQQDDNEQPKVTYILELQPKEGNANSLRLETTVSARRFDVSI